MTNLLYVLSLIASIIIGYETFEDYEDNVEISKCEQGGLHCEMRAIPVMEMRE